MKTKKYVILILFILNAAFIVWNSSKPAVTSDYYSKSLAERIAPILVADFDEMSAQEREGAIASLNHTARKLAHVFEFWLLGLLAMTLMQFFPAICGRHLNEPKKLLVSILFCILFAFMDETHQIFVDGRGFMVSDIAIDTAGSLTGALMVYISHRRRDRRFSAGEE